jgi:hypothetical protein
MEYILLGLSSPLITSLYMGNRTTHLAKIDDLAALDN